MVCRCAGAPAKVFYFVKNLGRRVSYSGLLYQPSKLRTRVRFPSPAHKNQEEFQHGALFDFSLRETGDGTDKIYLLNLFKNFYFANTILIVRLFLSMKELFL